MKRALLVLSLILGLAALVGCPAPSTPTGPGGGGTAQGAPGEPIAKIGSTTLTVEQIQQRIDEQSPFVRVRYADPEKKKEFLESQVRFEVLAAEAFARGMDKDPEVLEATKKIIVQKLTRDEFDGRVKLADVTDADLQKYFDEHQAEYQKPEMVRAAMIAVAFGTDKAAAKKTIDDVQKKAADKGKLEDRNFYKELVAQVSTDEATKRAGGDLRYLAGPEVEERFGAAAKAWLFANETVNEVSPVFEGKDAFYVFKRTAKRKAITRTFDQVKNQIRNVVFREKRTAAFNQLVADLEKKHGVTTYPEKLDKVKVNAQLPPGAAMDDEHGHGLGAGFPEGPPEEDDGEKAPPAPPTGVRQ